MQGRPLDPIQQKRSMEDPEIVSIMQDPAMNQVLQEMQSNPKAASRYLQDPVIKEKLDTLIYAGIIRVGSSVSFITPSWKRIIAIDVLGENVGVSKCRIPHCYYCRHMH